MYTEVMVVDNICPSCTITQLQGARGVCALGALVVVVLAGSITAMRIKERNLELKSNGKPD